MKRLDAIRRDTTRYDSTPCDPARKRVSSVVAARSKARGISYTRSIHARNSEHVNLGKSCEWPSTLLPSAPYPSSSFSIFILFSCLFAGLFSRCFRAMQTSVFVTRQKTTLGNVFTFRRAYSEPVQRRVLNELSDPLPRGASISTSSHRGFSRDENFPFRSSFETPIK